MAQSYPEPYAPGAQDGVRSANVDRGRIVRGVDGRKMKVYFFCNPPGTPDNTHDYHNAVCIAEGLRELGLTAFSNIDHWRDPKTGMYLFEHDPAVAPSDCDVVVVSQDWFERGLRIDDALLGGSGPVRIYLDKQDGSRIFSLEPTFPRFDRVLRASYQRNVRYPENFRPWAFGIAQRVIDATAAQRAASERHQCLLVSYRHTNYPHSLRLYVDRVVVSRIAKTMPVERFSEPFDAAPSNPAAAALWHLTGRRYSPAYYAALVDASACYAFGGYFVSTFFRSPNSLATRLVKRMIGKLGVATQQINQWDSYRFWESLAAGCATVHLDLAKYGCVLPVMPEAGRHYVGLDLGALDASVAVLGDPLRLAQIAEAGRAWALEHYRPRAVAERFLAEVGSVKAESR